MTWKMIPVDLQQQECHQRIRGKRKELMLEPTSENGGNADLQPVLLYFFLRKVQASNPIPPPVMSFEIKKMKSLILKARHKQHPPDL